MLNFFNQEKKILKEAEKSALKVIKKTEELKALSENALKARTIELKSAIEKGFDKTQILVDAFATAREAARRVLGLEAYKVQIMGAYIMHLGDVAEMRTGEGKTLTSVMTAYLNALDGKGVHIVTVNEYLCERDYLEMKPVFEFLGLSVGLNKRSIPQTAKKQAYAADITYSTNSELGFDYLRDNMVVDANKKVQRGVNFAIIDECDSILIDESRTPLIISGGEKGNPNLVGMVNKFVANLKEENGHFEIDKETKSVNLTTDGAKLAQMAFKINNLYEVKHGELLHAINNSLRANFIMKKDVDYAVRGQEIVIIDTFTGRLMPGRSFSNGLHQAIQAKESVKIKLESFVIATTTYQNFFRMYSKLAGMTGTAKTEEEEFVEIFNMRVIEVPTNLPIKRRDTKDKMYLTKSKMMENLIKEIFVRREKGQPVLVGTISVDASEMVSRSLTEAGIEHELLNAKNHSREADIIAKAGEKRSVTISTNMAGRGTDIKLGDGVRELGGLAVLGVERNESRRIDNQLRGRSGRQGDPGITTFYLSTEDDLIKRFDSNQFEKVVKTQGDKPLESSLVGKVLSSAQKRLEGMMFDMRKNLIKYDDVMRQQRELMYKQRDVLISTDDLGAIVNDFIQRGATDLVKTFTYEIEKEYKVHSEKLINLLTARKLIRAHSIIKADLDGKQAVEVASIIADEFIELYKDKNEGIPEHVIKEIQKKVCTQVFDKYWKEHIDKMTKLRSSVSLQSYKQENPLQVYIDESEKMFNEMKRKITNEITITLLSLKIQRKEKAPEAPKPVETPKVEEVPNEG